MTMEIRKNSVTGQTILQIDRGEEDDKDMVNHPTHYTSHPSGVEVIQITEHMNFCLGNAIKYILRSDLKGKQIEDLKKAVWYINREIDRLQRPNNG